MANMKRLLANSYAFLFPLFTITVFLDIKIGNEMAGRVIIGLFGNDCPKTAANFKSLCTCDHGKNKRSGVKLCYKKSAFHRIVPGFMLQGGDISKGNGWGVGDSIYDGNFPDENLKIKFDEPGMVAMASKGLPDLGAQFFITSGDASWLDGKHVVFGRVMQGMNVIRMMETQGTKSGVVIKPVVIIDSGAI